MIRKIIFLILLLHSFSCAKIVEINTDDFEKEIVVNCLFTEDNPFEVQIFSTNLFSDTSYVYITNAQVSIFSNSRDIVHMLKYRGDGIYMDTVFCPEINVQYEIEIMVPGYEPISASGSLPPPPDVTLIDFYRTNRTDPEVPHYLYNDIILHLSDSAGSDNYYEFIAFEYKYWSTGRLPNAQVGLISDEPVFKNEGDQELILGSLLLSDELFNGKNLEIKLSALGYPEEDTSWHIDLHILSLNSELYTHRKRLLRHKYAQSPDFFNMTEPVTMYSNITNGLGIFAGYNSKLITCYLRKTGAE